VPAGYPPPRRGLGGGAIAAIVGVGVLLVAGAAVFLLTGGGEPETPPSPPPTTGSPSPLPTDTPVTPVPPTTGPTDTLADLLPTRVSSFRLEGVAADPTAISNLGATDAIVARYVRGDGVVMIHNLMAFASGPSADLAKRQLVDSLVGNLGYVEVGVSRREGVNATRLIGADEMVVWSNRELVAAVEGPVNLTTGFFLVLPY
jgi:hypothetical protein